MFRHVPSPALGSNVPAWCLFFFNFLFEHCGISAVWVDLRDVLQFAEYHFNIDRTFCIKLSCIGLEPIQLSTLYVKFR